MSPLFPEPSRPAHAGLRRWCRGAAAGALLSSLGAVACGQTAVVEPEQPQSLAARPLELQRKRLPSSEVLRASVEVFGLTIATLESSLCSAPSGAAVLETEVEAAPLVQAIRRTSGEATTALPEPGGAPRSSDYTFRDGDVLRHYEIDYRPGSYAYVYDNGGVERRTGVDDVPEGAAPHDMHSAMLLLRGWRPRLDEQAYFYAVLGRRPWRVDVTSRGVEMIKLGEGDARLTYRIDGVAVRLWQPEAAARKRFTLWLSEDADRVPLRMVADASFGQVTLNMTGRDLGTATCSAATLAKAEGAARVGPRLPPTGIVGRAWASPEPGDADVPNDNEPARLRPR